MIKIVGINQKVGFTYLIIFLMSTRETITKISIMLSRNKSKYILSIINEKIDTAKSISNLVLGSSERVFFVGTLVEL